MLSSCISCQASRSLSSCSFCLFSAEHISSRDDSSRILFEGVEDVDETVPKLINTGEEEQKEDEEVEDNSQEWTYEQLLELGDTIGGEHRGGSEVHFQ